MHMNERVKRQLQLNGILVLVFSGIASIAWFKTGETMGIDLMLRIFLVFITFNIFLIGVEYKSPLLSYGLGAFLFSSFAYVASYYLDGIWFLWLNFALLIVSLARVLSGGLLYLHGRKLAIEKLEHLAYYNTITNLPNLNYVLRYETVSLESPVRELAYLLRDSERAAFLFIDLDDFKLVNDYLGHFSGDKLLREIADRLCHSIRSQDRVIHLSGDEFLIIINHLDGTDNLEKIIHRIIENVYAPVTLSGRGVQVSCSMGVSLYPEHGNNADELMRKADI